MGGADHTEAEDVDEAEVLSAWSDNVAHMDLSGGVLKYAEEIENYYVFEYDLDGRDVTLYFSTNTYWLQMIRESGFTDVKPGKWYTAYVIWAAELGIVNGTGNGKFTPNGQLTREQLCTMLVRYLESQGMELAEAANGKEFTDEADISKWALDSVNELRKAGIPVGYPDGSFRPKNPCTRAQAAAFLSRVICNILRNLD
jgi:hypothetical protein